jgi:hypothetical protein
MSWDVIVFNFRGSPPRDLESFESHEPPEALGTPNTVSRSIDEFLPGVHWSDPTAGLYEGDEFTIEFNLGGGEIVNTMHLQVRGSGDAVAALMQFAVPCGWSLLDCSTSKFLDPNNPSTEGWDGFQSLRNRAMEQYKQSDGSPDS